MTQLIPPGSKDPRTRSQRKAVTAAGVPHPTGEIPLTLVSVKH